MMAAGVEWAAVGKIDTEWRGTFLSQMATNGCSTGINWPVILAAIRLATAVSLNMTGAAIPNAA